MTSWWIYACRAGKSLLVGAGIFALIAIGVAALQVRVLVRSTDRGLAPLLSHASNVAAASESLPQRADALLTSFTKVGDRAVTVEDKAAGLVDETRGNLGATFANINRPCGSKAPCGTLADLDRTLATFRGTAGEVEAALRHESAELDALNAQERTTADDAHGVLVSAKQVMDDYHALYPAMQRALDGAAVTSEQGGRIVTNLRIESDRLMAPQPWWKRVLSAGDTGVKLACIVTKRCLW
ncbi:hypothetical protein SAMN05421819_3553 [Bryocella elongata]|uniref:Uncharacterized protein n=1 Tax=Bryocella elongata TaxID=863522 RepID=A0A1H6B7W5_9BACT|nr:hypothetical protein [Bryocella elongata]SEG56216.1 hypothetical protein SAMN05421819_3553 [Bryocella elongata]